MAFRCSIFSNFIPSWEYFRLYITIVMPPSDPLHFPTSPNSMSSLKKNPLEPIFAAPYSWVCELQLEYGWSTRGLICKETWLSFPQKSTIVHSSPVKVGRGINSSSLHARMLTGLILHRSCIGNHSYCEFECVQKSRCVLSPLQPLALTFFLPPFFNGSQAFRVRGVA